MKLIRDGWHVATAAIDRQGSRLTVYGVHGDVILQGLGPDHWRPNHDPGDEDPGDPEPDLRNFKIRFA